MRMIFLILLLMVAPALAGGDRHRPNQPATPAPAPPVSDDGGGGGGGSSAGKVIAAGIVIGLVYCAFKGCFSGEQKIPDPAPGRVTPDIPDSRLRIGTEPKQ